MKKLCNRSSKFKEITPFITYNKKDKLKKHTEKTLPSLRANILLTKIMNWPKI